MKNFHKIFTLSYSPLSLVKGLFFTVLFISVFSNSSTAYAVKASPVQISIFDPVQLIDNKATIYGLRVNLIYGKNYAVYGIDLGPVNQTTDGVGGIQAGIANINHWDLTGIQAGIANWSEQQNSYGLQIGGANMLGGSGTYKGFQLGVANVEVDGSFYGMQFGGVNYAKNMYGPQLGAICLAEDDMATLQAGLILNMVGRDMTGLQVNIFGNAVAGDMKGIQAGTIINLAEKLKGAQLALGCNVVSYDVYGLQIGVVNVADRVKGVQIGIINYTKRMSGVQVGVVNIITEGMIPVFPLFNASMTF